MDPNEVVGQPRDYWIWLAPDWSDWSEDTKPSKDATHVKVRETTYRDGRKVTQVLDEGGKPVSDQNGPRPALTEGINKQVQDKWKSDQTTAQRGDQEGDTRGPQDKPKREVYRSGKWTTEDNPVYQPQPPQATPRNPDQQRADAANASKSEQDAAEATRVANESSWNADPANRANGGSGRYETHAVRDARLAKETADAETKARQARIDEQNTATAAANARRADSVEARAIAEANRVGSKVDDLPVNGRHYSRITKTSPDGRTTIIENYGPDGNRIDAIPGEGAASVGGPPMPTIILGATEDAARKYHAALWADPNLTPAQREKRFAEFIQVATVAQNEAITAQRERESQRNADYNTAATKLNFLESSQDSALKFVSDLNGKLPVGSSAGGDAFVALMGLQMLNMKMSGINSLKGAGSYTDAQRNQPAAPTITPADLAKPDAMAAKREQIMAHPVFRPQEPVNLPSQSVTAPPVPAAATASAPQPAAAPAGQAPAVPTMPAATPPGGEVWVSNDGAYTYTPDGNVYSVGPQGTPVLAGTWDPSMGTPADARRQGQDSNTRPIAPEAAPSYAKPDDSPIWQPAAPLPPAVPSAGPSVNPDGTPDYGAPGMRVLPQSAPPPPDVQYGTPETMTPGAPIQVPGEAPGVSVPYPDSAGAVSMAPLPPALASLLPPMPPVQPAMQQPMGDASQSPALLHVQAASKPIWEMTESEVEAYRRAGVPDSVIFSVPGRSAAA